MPLKHLSSLYLYYETFRDNPEAKSRSFIVSVRRPRGRRSFLASQRSRQSLQVFRVRNGIHERQQVDGSGKTTDKHGAVLLCHRRRTRRARDEVHLLVQVRLLQCVVSMQEWMAGCPTPLSHTHLTLSFCMAALFFDKSRPQSCIA